MKLVLPFSLLFFCLNAFANKIACFEEKKEMMIPQTKFTLTTRGEVLNGSQKFANLPLPKGFLGECLLATSIKTDTLVILSMGAQDYDKKNAFIFRLSNKDTKILWSQHIKNPVQPLMPFINEKVIVIPTVGEAIAMNPETGGIRWSFGSTEPELVDFKKFSLQGTTLQAEGVTIIAGETTPAKFELNVHNGRLIPSKKAVAP